MRRLFSRPLYMYIIGYVLSLVATLNTFAFVVMSGSYSETMLISSLALLAVLQIIIQIIFFIHLGNEDKPRWNSLAFFTMLLVVSCIVGGSLWVMRGLDYNMSGHEAETYIIQDEGIQPQGSPSTDTEHEAHHE